MWLVAGLFGVAVVIFAAWVWRPAFWVDEYLTQAAISQPWPDLVQRIVTIDPGPGPYYLAMNIWSAVSTAPGWMRLPSVLAAAGAVVLFAVLVRRMTDTGPPHSRRPCCWSCRMCPATPRSTVRTRSRCCSACWR